MENRISNIHIFGAKSKFLTFILVHPFYSGVICSILSVLAVFLVDMQIDELFLRSMSYLSSVSLGTALIARLTCYRICYRTKIDLTKNMIYFFLMFQKDSVAAPIQQVEFYVNGYFVFSFQGKKYYVSQEHINPIIDLLPNIKEVSFAGLFRWAWKKRFERKYKLMGSKRVYRLIYNKKKKGGKC